MDIELFHPLEKVSSEEAEKFEAELQREMSNGHVLKDESFECIARREDRDDFLFYVTSIEKFAIVHLTWNVEKSPDWPTTTLYNSFDELRQNWDSDFF